MHDVVTCLLRRAQAWSVFDSVASFCVVGSLIQLRSGIIRLDLKSIDFHLKFSILIDEEANER